MASNNDDLDLKKDRSLDKNVYFYVYFIFEKF